MTSKVIGFLVIELSGPGREQHEAEMHREATRLNRSLTMIAYAEKMSDAAFVRLLNLVDREMADLVLVPSRPHLGSLDLTPLVERADVYCLDDSAQHAVHAQDVATPT
ncbi:hypothetical protein [Nocardia sp. NPDC127526]|uniref:hypothetical protein n=1 Tax=Nocardia sp. NPDC127526 TaxID=3345393 RepID=UPI003638DA90